MSGYVTAKDAALRLGRFLSKREVLSPYQVDETKDFYFPFWQLSKHQSKEKLFWAARVPLVDDLAYISALSGQTDKLVPNDVAEHLLWEPEILMEDALIQAQGNLSVKMSQEDAASLVHVPFFEIKYTVLGRQYSAYIECVRGTVYADELPVSPQRKKSSVLALVALGALILSIGHVYFLPSIMLWVTYPVMLLLLYLLITHILTRFGW